MSEFPFLDSLAQEIDLAHFETEERARKLIQEDLTALREKRAVVFEAARNRISKHGEKLQAMNDHLDAALEKLTNGVRPTGTNSNTN